MSAVEAATGLALERERRCSLSPLRPAQVVVLMGGLGTRLGSAAGGGPKSMAPVHGKPFFAYQLEQMREQGFRDFVFCVGHKSSAVMDYFGDGSQMGVRIRYSEDGRANLGTGGAIRNALPLLDDHFLVIYGDSYMDIDFIELLYHYRTRCAAEGQLSLMSVFRNNNRLGASNVLFEDGRLLLYDKRQPLSVMEHIDYGATVLDRGAIEELMDEATSDLADFYNELVRQGLMGGHEVVTPFREIGTPGALEDFRRYAAGRFLLEKPAVFVDRDGTINEQVFYSEDEPADSPVEPFQLRLLPGAAEGLRMIKGLGYRLVVITNQPGAAKGKAPLGSLYAVNRRLRELLARSGVALDDVLMCPHHPTGSVTSVEPYLITECACRKPAPGLIERAIRKFNVDRAVSFMVGDSPGDAQAGRAAGVRSVLLGARAGNGSNPQSLFDFARALTRARSTG